MPAGRPTTERYLPETLIPKVAAYLGQCKAAGVVPILKEFCLMHGLHYSHIDTLAKGDDELAQAIKSILITKEAALERGALDGTLNPTAAIFSLKQLGWRDKSEVETNGSMRIEVVRADSLPVSED